MSQHSRSLITFYEDNFVVMGVNVRALWRRSRVAEKSARWQWDAQIAFSSLTNEPPNTVSIIISHRVALSRDENFHDDVNDHKCQRKIIIIICWCNFNYGLLLMPQKQLRTMSIACRRKRKYFMSILIYCSHYIPNINNMLPAWLVVVTTHSF